MDEGAWDGKAYPLKDLYLDGEDTIRIFPDWDVTQPDGTVIKLPGPHEYRHTLSTVVNADGRLWLYLARDLGIGSDPEKDPEPGSWSTSPRWPHRIWRRFEDWEKIETRSTRRNSKVREIQYLPAA